MNLRETFNKELLSQLKDKLGVKNVMAVPKLTKVVINMGVGEALTDNSFVTDHYRRFVEFDSFISRLEGAGFKVLYKLQSKGLAVYKTEDPIVIRVIGQR